MGKDIKRKPAKGNRGGRSQVNLGKQPAKKERAAKPKAAPKKRVVAKKQKPPIKKPQKPKAAKNPKHRPSSYFPDLANYAFQLALLGFDDAQIYENLEIAKPTFYEWKRKYPEFADAIARGKARADGKVANALYQRAVGMLIPKVHVSNYQGKVTLTDLHEYIPPDTAAAKFWLKNRQKELWKDVFGHTDGDGGALAITIHENLRPKE